VFDHSGGVVLRDFRITCQRAEWTTIWTDGAPRVAIDLDMLDLDDEHVAFLRAVDIDRTADRVRQRRRTIEAGPLAGNRQVFRRLEEAGARVVGFDFKRLAGGDLEERFIAPVESVFAGVFAVDAFHRCGCLGSGHGGQSECV